MPISTVSPTSAILCAGSDASFLKVSRTPYRSTVNRVFDERTCTRTRGQPCFTLSTTTARRNLLVSSAVSRSSRSALRKPRSIAILYCIVSGAPVRPPHLHPPPMGRWARPVTAKRQRTTVVLFADDVHCPPQGGRTLSGLPDKVSAELNFNSRPTLQNAREPWSDWTIFFGRIAFRKD